jgi:hypothetical protein
MTSLGVEPATLRRVAYSALMNYGTAVGTEGGPTICRSSQLLP